MRQSLFTAICLAAAAGLSTTVWGQTGGGPAGAATAVPPSLQPPSGAAPYLRANAKGSQIYSCAAKPDGSFGWTLKGPDAVLADAAGQPIGKHYAGPTWEAIDGSKVVGEVAANAPAPGGQALAWLLLKAKSNAGAGTFSPATYIQPIDTSGGVAPAAGCDAAHAGLEQSVPYTAVYVFYRPT